MLLFNPKISILVVISSYTNVIEINDFKKSSFMLVLNCISYIGINTYVYLTRINVFN